MNMPGGLTSPSGGELLPGIESRQYQLDALGALAEARARGDKEALVTMATGLGKTSLAALDIDQFAREVPGARVLVLAHRTEILSQVWDRVHRPLAEHNFGYYMLSPRYIPEELDQMSFVLASFQMMHRGLYQRAPIRELFNRDRFDYILVDEAHHATAPTFQPTIDFFSPQFLLGITATPERSDNRHIMEVFKREVYRKSLPEGIAEGHLAKPHYVAIAPKATIEEVETDTPETPQHFLMPDYQTAVEVTDDIFERTMHIENPKILVYTRSIEEAELYANLMPNAQAIHSGLSSDGRTEILDDFRANRPRTLTSVDIMNEGIDVSDIDVIAMVRSTASETVLLQQIGRGLRRAPGKEEVLILDYVANADRLAMIARLINGFPNPRQKDEEEKPERPREPRLEEVITAPEIDLENATFEFDHTVLDIVQLLYAREEKRRLIAAQTPEKSVDEYLVLCEKHGKLLSVNALRRTIGHNETELLLMPFDGHITELRERAGYPLLKDHPELVTVSAASKELNIEYRDLLRVLQQLDIEIKDAIAETGMVSRTIRRANIEDVEYLLHLIDTPGATLKQHLDIPASRISVAELQQTLLSGASVSAIRLALREIGITEYRQLLYKPGPDGYRFGAGSINRAEQGRLLEYVQHLPTAKKSDVSIEQIIRETGEKQMGYLLGELQIRGWCAISPTTGRIERYVHPSQAKLIRSNIR